MDKDFALCNHCGETFFKEHLIKGKCRPCIDLHMPICDATNNIED